jgi:hypothetical protein
MNKYKVVNDTCYHIDTSDKVINILEQCRLNKSRIVLDYGDNGISWNEKFEITGTIGRSTGISKIPILVHNIRSTGGAEILTHCIIGIKESKGGKILYSHNID